MGDYGEVHWMECVIFQGYANGTWFVGLAGYAQWDLVRGPFRICPMGLSSWAFQDKYNGT